MELGKYFLYLFFIISSAASAGVTMIKSEEKPIKIWFDGQGKKPFAIDSLVVPAASLQAAVLGKNILIDNNLSYLPGNIDQWHWDFKTKEFHLKIKDNLKFSNGRKVTSEDLIFSLTRGFFSKKPSFFFSNFSSIDGIQKIPPQTKYSSHQIRGIRVISESEIVIKLAHDNPNFLNALSYSYFSLVPKEELQDDYFTWKNWPIGAGSYKITFSSPTSSLIRLEKNTSLANSKAPTVIELTTDGDYTKADVVVGGNTTRPSNQFKKYKNTSFEFVSIIAFNSNSNLGNNTLFRQAIRSAINQDKLTEANEDLIAATEFLPSRFWGRLSKTENFYDPAYTKEILKKLKVSNITVPIRGTSIDQKTTEKLKEQLSASGITVNFINDGKKIWDASVESYPFIVISLAVDSLDPLSELSVFRRGSFLTPYINTSEEIEKFFIKANENINSEDRIKYVKELQNALYSNIGYIPLFFRNDTIWFDSRKISSIGNQNGGMTFFLERLELAENK